MLKKIKNEHQFENGLISWEAPEYARHEKSRIWFVVFCAVMGSLVLYGLTTGGITFSIAILVFAGTYYLLHRENPAVVTVTISKSGVSVGRHVFPYSHLKGFWIVHEPPFVSKLYLRMASRFKPDVFVSLEGANAADVREVLKGHLREFTGRHEPVSDALVRLLRL